ncbi:MAG TPA: ABC transporter permease [Rhodanobacteraceae bacterium]|jgi:phospholipid/cholesterol/gamma-HCH transport system permease protein|nr:ABC transporter permease [Rhodanobacteraceae bacterium]
MTQPASGPAWKREGDARIALSGSWNLLVGKRRRRRLLREFRQLASPNEYCWDLQHVEALDSTGALVLWRAWDGQLPREIDCSEDQRRLFERLADTPPLTSPVDNRATGWLDRLGSGVLSVLKTGGGILLLTGQLMVDSAWCVRHPTVTPWKETSANVYRIGATSMLLLGSIGLLIGAVMTIQVGRVLQMFSASQLVIGMMATAVPRELGPVVVGLIMAGRAGSAMTASIGAMHITEEYNALRAFGSSPSLRLALPRVVGAAASMSLLVVWTDVATLLGSALAAPATLGISYRLFLEQFVQQVQIVNFWIGLGKGALFGAVIALVGCYFGMSASPDTESLSRNTTLSVVTSLTLVLLIDASLGAALTNVGLF